MITKTVRLTGSSPDAIEDAINGVLGRAAETLSDIQRFKVVEVGGLLRREVATDDRESQDGDTGATHSLRHL